MSRVTVVLSQGRRLGVEQQHREDELIAALLMHPSAEATIIANLTEIDADSTDRLCLESITGTAILFAWHPSQVASDVFEKLGIAARLIDQSERAGDPTEALSIHYFDLNEPEPQQIYEDRINQVAEEAAVAPVALTNLVNGDNVPLAASNSDFGGSVRQDSPHPSAANMPQPTQAGDSEDRDALDDLMDAFDAVDL